MAAETHVMASEHNGQSFEVARVRLHPFLHQVGGSTLMFAFDKYTICKPLLRNEYQFYKFIPDTLKPFTPQYKGSVDIVQELADDGTQNYFAVIPLSKIKALKLDMPTVLSAGSPVVDVGSEESHVSMDLDFLQSSDFRVKRSGSIELNEDSLDCYDNPTSKLAVGSRLNKRLAELLEEQEQRFILLENLVADYCQPSILDLKMGTRTYGDDESDAKKQRKRRRAEDSTSKGLGVRLHGMQKFNVVSGKYETVDKCVGLCLTADEFKKSVMNFLYDGSRVRRELLPAIISRLRQFHDCLSKQNTFRFYSSSLLLIYDGVDSYRESSAHEHPKLNIKAIDFAHTTYEYTCNGSCVDQVTDPMSVCTNTSSTNANGAVRHLGPDEGYLLGLRSLITIFSDIQ